MWESDHNQPPHISRTQRKNQVQALQKMGEALVLLSPTELAQIPLEPILEKAIVTARSLTTHEAKRRQLQYIGKLMRNVDPQPIQEALDKIKLKNQQGKAQFHQIERWRDRLIAEGDQALKVFLEKFPQADSQELRQLIRKAQRDLAAKKNSGADTTLFRYLRDIMGKTDLSS